MSIRGAWLSAAAVVLVGWWVLTSLACRRIVLRRPPRSHEAHFRLTDTSLCGAGNPAALIPHAEASKHGEVHESGSLLASESPGVLRRMELVFSPLAARASCLYQVTTTGVRGVVRAS